VTWLPPDAAWHARPTRSVSSRLAIGVYGCFVGLAIVAAMLGVFRFWRAMRRSDEAAGTYSVARTIPASIRTAVKDILTHYRFGFCQAQRQRRLAHLALFYGFAALLLVTLWAVADLYVGPYMGFASRYPFGLLHPVKILANAGGAILIFGAAKVVVDRWRTQGPGAAGGTAFDWIFVWLILAVCATGFATEILRFGAGTAPEEVVRTVAYSIYFLHLVLVFQLLVYFPYSKFAHVAYRAAAMVYAEHTGRYRPARRMEASNAASSPRFARLKS